MKKKVGLLLSMFALIFQVAAIAASGNDMNLNPVVKYIVEVNPDSNSSSESLAQVAKDWDATILASTVIAGYESSKIKAGGADGFDVFSSAYKAMGFSIVTKQTSCVWVAEIEADNLADVVKGIVALPLMLNQASAADKTIGNVIAMNASKIVAAQQTTVFEIYFKSEGQIASWHSEMRGMISDNKLILWTLKLTGRPMAADVGYDEALNRNWFRRFKDGSKP